MEFLFLKHTDHSSVHLAQQEIHRMLGEVLGGINCVKLAALTPYFYTVGEFNLRPHLSRRVVGIVLHF